MIPWYSLPTLMSVAFFVYLLLIRPGREFAQDYGRAIWWLMVISGGSICVLSFALAFLLMVMS